MRRSRRTTRSDRRPNDPIRKLYQKKQWNHPKRGVRAWVLARDSHLCQQCAADGIAVEGNQVDHVIPAREAPDKFFDIDNLQTLCQRCHSRKTRGGE